MSDVIKSSLGRKYLMALTGLMLLGFVVVHLLGNLQIFGGPDLMNNYAQALKDLGPLLWVARIGLITIFLLHIVTAATLQAANKSARPPRLCQCSDHKSHPHFSYHDSIGIIDSGLCHLSPPSLHATCYQSRILPNLQMAKGVLMFTAW